jgi:phosphohistidine swiveling domain-containing protein
MPREIFKYKLSTLPYFYCQNMTAPTLRYNNKPIIGEWLVFFNKANTSSSEAVADTHSFLASEQDFFELLKSNEPKISKHIFDLFNKIIELSNKFEKISYIDHKTDNVSDLKDFYNEYVEYFVPAFAFGYVLDFLLDKWIKENNFDLSKIRTVGQSFINKEKNDLHNIFLEDEEKQEEPLKEHALKYNWVLNNYSGEYPIDINYFKSRKKEVSNLNDQKIEVLENPQTVNEWIEYLTYIRDERKKLNLISIGLMDRYLKNKCKENNINYKDATMLTVSEFEDVLQGKKMIEHNERYMKSSFAGPVDISKEDFIKFSEESIEFNNILKGSIASKGLTSGTVKVILSRDDFEKVNNGDILVASMTRPEFAPILSKCSAIITNEGGITCHAAIISRELGIPCIIGTKIATKVLKDGDMVEVDAYNGIVRIIK